MHTTRKSGEDKTDSAGFLLSLRIDTHYHGVNNAGLFSLKTCDAIVTAIFKGIV
jgi:hypothetical protein